MFFVSSSMSPRFATVLRTVLVGLVLSAASLFSMTAPASAASCTCKAAASASPTSNGTSGQNSTSRLDRKARRALLGHLKAADVVVSGTISAVDDSPRPESFTVRLTRIYRGKVTTPTLTFEQSPTCPQRDVVTGQQWFVLAEQPKADGARPQVSVCTGSVILDGSVTRVVEKTLGTGTAAPQPPPPSATFTSVEGSGPARFTRMAAPGAAMVVVGLLGMLVVGRLGRPRAD